MFLLESVIKDLGISIQQPVDLWDTTASGQHGSVKALSFLYLFMIYN